MRRVLAIALVVSGCIPQGSGEQELRTRVPGTWVGTTPDGMKLTMHLAPDGTGEVNGHAGSWEIKIGRILLSDGDHMVPCDLDGDELTCHTPDGDLVMARAKPGEEVAAAPPAEKPAEPAKPFAPEKTVPGQPFIAPANGPISGASFTTPDGWTHGGGKFKTHDVHVLARVDAPDNNISIARLPAPKTPDREALAEAMDFYVVGRGEPLVEPETIDVAGQRGARAIVKAEGVEYYVAIVRGNDVIFVIVGRYPADQAEAMRPVVETVLASFRTSP